MKDHIQFIMGKLQPEHLLFLFLFKDGWDSISFPFIFYEGVRKNAAEEAIRLELKEYIVITAGVMMYDVLRFCVMIPPKIAVQDYDIRVGRDKVAANYRLMPSWGPLSKIPKGIGRLPASARFDMKKRTMKPKKTSNFPDAEGW